MHEDVLEDIKQMALFKYGGIPHWGKNRDLAQMISIVHRKKDTFVVQAKCILMH